MKKHYDVVVVIPVGPGCLPANIADTINSFIHYTRSSYKIILADDSQLETGLLIKKDFPHVDVISTRYPQGKLCGLYITLSLAYRYALKHFRFTSLLRMDTDALITGEAPEREAIALFKANPAIGIAGQYPLDYNGNPWDISWPQKQVLRLTGSRTFFRKPFAHALLWLRYKKALQNGYNTGESVFGGAYFMSEACLKKLKGAGLLPSRLLKPVLLEEDHLFAILIKSLGFQFGDLASGTLPFGCAWKGLPAAPEDLFEKGKKIIHSTRYWHDMKEAEIRSFFREKRGSGEQQNENASVAFAR